MKPSIPFSLQGLSQVKIWLLICLVLVSTLLGRAEAMAQITPPITRIIAEKINLDVSVVEMGWTTKNRDGQSIKTWVIPDTAAGWHKDSKLPGQGGNTVLSGHNNSHSEVFSHISELEPQDVITLYVGDQPYYYAVVEKLLLQDKGEPESVRRENARWIGPINEERLTLVSAWPYVDSTHKVIVVAWPVEAEERVTPTIEEVTREEEILPSLTDNPLVAEVQTPAFTPKETTSIPTVPVLPPVTRIVVPNIGLNSTVIQVGWRQVMRDNGPANVWEVADYAVGWHKNSKLPGQGGNVVFSGHHNVKGKVFRYLERLDRGDTITLYQDNQPSYYVVVDRVIVREKGEPESVRRENARWIGPANEERLTLVSCWPYETNTHRLIVMAKPTSPPSPPKVIDPLLVEGRTIVPSQIAASTPVKDLAVPAAVFPTPSSPSFLPQATASLTRIVAEKINLNASVVEMGWEVMTHIGESNKVWVMPDDAAGWHRDSILPGQGGNVVLSGYHNIRGEKFRYIVDLQQGDIITLYLGDQPYRYAVVDKLILKEKGESSVVRRENARWIGPINEERLTLVTGWPYTGNTHRVIVIARPI